MTHNRLSSLLISLLSLLRGLPLFIAARPQTPLRILCITAFDTLHVLRHAKRLPACRIKMLAALLDYAACANRAFDKKNFCRAEFRAARQLLRDASLRPVLAEYLRRLRQLERSRPKPGGDQRQFDDVGLYREGVVRLSLGLIAVAAFGNESLDEAVRATSCDEDFVILFRIVMQCQIIDDVLDYSKDSRAGLPSFLTAPRSLRQAFQLIRLAAVRYADDRSMPRSSATFALRLALFFASVCARLMIRFGRWRHGIFFGQQLPEPVYGS